MKMVVAVFSHKCILLMDKKKQTNRTTHREVQFEDDLQWTGKGVCLRQPEQAFWLLTVRPVQLLQLQQKHEIEKAAQTKIWAWAVIELSHFILTPPVSGPDSSLVFNSLSSPWGASRWAGIRGASRIKWAFLPSSLASSTSLEWLSEQKIKSTHTFLLESALMALADNLSWPTAGQP